MHLPAFIRQPLFRRLLLGPPIVLAVVLGVRHFVAVDAEAARVDQGPVSLEIRGTGTLESVQEVPLAFKVGGRIQSLPLDEGSPVRAGQVIGLLDPRDLKENLAVAQAARGAAAAGIGRARADLGQATAAQFRARADFDRARHLQSEGILSRADLDAAQERLKVTEATVQAMEAAGLQARRGESQAEGTEALQALAFQEGRLISPVDGLLTRRLHEPGHIVAAGTPVLTVVSTRKLWVRAWVDEGALGTLRIGQTAGVELRSHPGRILPGRVDRIGRQSDRQTHELLVDVEVLELPPAFAVGQRADVRIRTSGSLSSLRVPAAFVAADGSMFVDRSGRARRVRPELGARGTAFVEIRNGLALGDPILRPARNTSPLGDGRRFRLAVGP